jgi:hypothetical protein
MKIIYLLLLFVFSETYVFAQTSWEHTDGPFGSVLSSIYSNDQYAFIPEDDFLYRSSDGINWEKIEHPVSYLISVYKDTLVNLYRDEALQKMIFQVSVDNGETWDAKDPPAQVTGYGVSMVITGHGIYLSKPDEDLFYKSTDLGDSWFLTPYPFSQGYDLTTFDNRLFFNGSSLLTMSDSVGKNWKDITPPIGSQNIYDFVAKDHHILVAGENTIFHSHDGGQTWKGVSIATRNASDKLTLVGNDIYLQAIYYLMRSSDFGITWDTLSYSDFNIELVNHVGLQNLFLTTTYNKGVFRWEDSVNALVESNEGFSKGYVYDLSLEGNTIWAACGNGIFSFDITTNTWSDKKQLPLPEFEYEYITANDHGWLITSDLYKDNYYFSEDYGETWDSIHVDIPQVYYPEWMQLVGDRFFLFAEFTIYTSIDKGQNWNIIPFEYNEAKIVPFKGKYYIAAVDRLIGSSDGGATWQVLNSDISINYLHVFGDRMYGISQATSDPELYTSVDGIHWIYTAPGLPDDFSPPYPGNHSDALFFYDADNQYAFLGWKGHYILPNGAQAWAEMNTTHTGNNYLVHDDVVYLGGSGVYRSVIENPAITGLAHPEISNERIFAFPSPIDDWLTLKIPETFLSDNIHLILFDNTGRLTESKVVGPATIVQLDLHDVAPGIYFLYVSSGNHGEIIKVVKQ